MVFNLLNLTHFLIDSNGNIYGTIPNTICNLSKLLLFAIQYIKQTGFIPLCISQNNQLSIYAFADTPFLKMNQSHIINLCQYSNKHLQYLWLIAINYTGILPECIGINLTNLQSIRIQLGSYNINGSIPNSFKNLTQLSLVQIDDVPNLYGEIPIEWFGKNIQEIGFNHAPNLVINHNLVMNKIMDIFIKIILL